MIDATVKKTLRVLVTTILFMLVVYVTFQLRDVITWLAIGTFLAIMINPAVDWFTRKTPGHKRGVGVAAVIISTVIVIIGSFILFTIPLTQQTANLINNWPEISANLTENIRQSDQQPYKFIRDNDLATYVEQHSQDVQKGLSSIFANSLNQLNGLAGSIAALSTIITAAAFISANGPKYLESLFKFVPNKNLSKTKELLNEMYKAVSGYVGGTLTTSIIAGVATTVVCMLAGVPYAALLGLMVGLFDLIPLVGATIGAVVTVIVALFTSVNAAVIIAIFFVIYQQLENSFIVPKVMGKTVSISSFIIFIATLSGAVLAGLVGALISIPIAACLQILADFYFENRSNKKQTT